MDTIKGSDPLDNSEMGVVLGPLASLNNIMLALGHHGRDIQMLKIDCTSPWRHDVGLVAIVRAERADTTPDSGAAMRALQ